MPIPAPLPPPRMKDRGAKDATPLASRNMVRVEGKRILRGVEKG